MSSVCYIGSSAAAQTKVSDSPSFGKVAPPAQERKGILVFDGAMASEVAFVETDAHVGWIQRHPTNGCIYLASNSKIHAATVDAQGVPSLTGSNAEALGNPAHFEITKDGKWVLCANYSASTLAV
eukprot:3362318-Prymnesium_polylepis.1